jgi:hypothetical protein
VCAARTDSERRLSPGRRKSAAHSSVNTPTSRARADRGPGAHSLAAVPASWAQSRSARLRQVRGLLRRSQAQHDDGGPSWSSTPPWRDLSQADAHRECRTITMMHASAQVMARC